MITRIWADLIDLWLAAQRAGTHLAPFRSPAQNVWRALPGDLVALTIMRLCGGLKSLGLTVPIIRSHHERWDGSGYPDGLQGEEIPLLARVFQICDIHDALSFARPYKPALSTAEVRRILLEETARGWRDPTLVEVFIGLVDSDPDAVMVREDVAEDLGRSLFDALQGAAGQTDLTYSGT